LFLRQQKLVQRAIHGRELPHFIVGDEIDVVHRRPQRFQIPQVAVVAHEIVQEPGRHLAPLRSLATRHSLHRGLQAVARNLALLQNQFLYSSALLARDQRIL
jgi:hypothetical protein